MEPLAASNQLYRPRTFLDLQPGDHFTFHKDPEIYQFLRLEKDKWQGKDKAVYTGHNCDGDEGPWKCHHGEIVSEVPQEWMEEYLANPREYNRKLQEE